MTYNVFGGTLSLTQSINQSHWMSFTMAVNTQHSQDRTDFTIYRFIL